MNEKRERIERYKEVFGEMVDALEQLRSLDLFKKFNTEIDDFLGKFKAQEQSEIENESIKIELQILIEKMKTKISDGVRNLFNALNDQKIYVGVANNQENEIELRGEHFEFLVNDIRDLHIEKEKLIKARKEAIQAKDDQLKAKFEKEIEGIEEQIRRKNKAKSIEEKVLRQAKRKELEENREYYDCKTAMEYIYKIAGEISFDKGKDKIKRYARIIDLINTPELKNISVNSTNYKHKDEAVALDEYYDKKISGLYRELSMSDEDEKDSLYQEIENVKKERKEKLDTLLDNKYVLYLVLKRYEKSGSENWRVYAPYLESKAFNALLKKSKTQLKKVIKDKNGEYEIYGQKFTKK